MTTNIDFYKAQFVRLVYEIVSRDIMTDYDDYHSGMALDHNDRRKIRIRLGVDRYLQFKAYRKKVIKTSISHLVKTRKLNTEQSKVHLINNGWRISILEGFERKLTTKYMDGISNVIFDEYEK